jgi:ABC-type transporter lipoprotein component MlaA
MVILYIYQRQTQAEAWRVHTPPKNPFLFLFALIFEFNQGLDETLFEPVAKSYKENVPKPAQNRVSDFSSNIGDTNLLYKCIK